MNKLIILTFIPLLFSCNQASITYTDYYQNGNKRIEVSCLKGKLHGSYTMWFENGNKLLETVFENDSIVSLVTIWLPNGQQAMEVHFDQLNINRAAILNRVDNKEQIPHMERRMIYGWLKYEAEKLRDKIKQESLSYHRIKCLLFSTLV